MRRLASLAQKKKKKEKNNYHAPVEAVKRVVGPLPHPLEHLDGFVGTW